MKILLTGVTGYIAQRLLPVLLENGHQVWCCVRDAKRFDAAKYNSNNITVLEDFSFDAPKTKKYADLISNLKLSDKKTLLVLGESNKNVYLSSRNLGKAKVITASELNTYDILNANNLLLVESSVKEIENLLGNK